MRVTAHPAAVRGIVLLLFLLLVCLLGAGAASAASAAPAPATGPAAVTPILYLPADLWSWRNPLPSGDEFQAVSMPNGHDAWAVTVHGGIYCSDDGGRHWWLQISRGDENWTSVFALNANRAWVVGRQGEMRSTNDGGATWTHRASGTDLDLQDVFFTSAEDGWAVGAGKTLLRTTDGGATWTPRSSDAVGAIDAVMFLNSQRGWICDNSGGVSRTVDGGSSWTRVVVADGNVFRDVCFVTATRGWAICDAAPGTFGKVYATVDGGATWTPQVASSSAGFRSLFFTSPTNGWICRDDGAPFHTTDAGANWTDLVDGAPPDTYRVRAIGGADGTHMVLVGNAKAWTANGGEDWTFIDRSVTGDQLNDVTFASRRYGWAVGQNGTVLRTRDGGARWSLSTTIGIDHVYGVSAPSSNRAVVVGQLNGTYNGFLYFTTDAGLTWNPTGPSPVSLTYCVDFASPLMGWAGGDYGILKTRDGGASWESVQDEMTKSTHDLDFVTRTLGWAANGNDLYRSTDGGAHWTLRPTPSWNGGPSKVSFADGQHGWIIWADGQLAGTTNGAQTWTQQALDAGEVFTDVAAQSSSRAWAVGELGTIYRTIDGGLHWTRQNSRTGTGVTIRSVCAKDGIVWAVGDDGVIMARNFTPPPHIVQATPSPLDPGDTLTIDGWGFGTWKGSSAVTIGGKTVTAFTIWRDMRLKVKVPSMAAGTKVVKVVVGGVTANTVRVKVR